MGDFDRYLERQLQDSEFRKEWDSLEPEHAAMQAIISARRSRNMTQKELSAATGISQADISRIETGNANPTLQMLKRLADGLGMMLKLEFVPNASAAL